MEQCFSELKSTFNDYFLIMSNSTCTSQLQWPIPNRNKSICSNSEEREIKNVLDEAEILF